MNIYKTLTVLLSSCATVVSIAQISVTGKVTDESGAALAGVSVVLPGTTTGTVTDAYGRYNLSVPDDATSLSFYLLGYSNIEMAITDKALPVDAVLESLDPDAGKTFVGNDLCRRLTIAENVSSVSIISKEQIKNRPAKNVGNTLFGLGLGLSTLQGRGQYADYNPTFYVRGLKTLTDEGNTPLIMVDGVERDIDNISPYEVEQVTILKDASALALYGYKGANGAINITTKHGQHNTKSISVGYEHFFERQFRRPEFVDAATYAMAANEAKINDGGTAYYTDDAIKAYQNGTDPEYFPNIDWQAETLRDWAKTNNLNVTFSGGSKKFRYYTMLNLHGNRGFNAHGDDNADYNTQDQFSRGTVRSNIDIDLTPSTKMTLNILGNLREARETGTNFTWSSYYVGYSTTDMWDAIYSVPSNAFPIKVGGYWGGATDGSTFDGSYNPVGIVSDAGYIKKHARNIFLDLNIDQDFSAFLPGLGASFRLAYDNTATYIENYTRVYDYASYLVSGGSACTFNADGTVATGPSLSISQDSDGNSIATSLSSDAYISAYTRNVSIYGNIYYDKKINDNNKIYAQLRYDFEKRDSRGVNTTYYYQNAGGYVHYMFNNIIADFTFMGSAYNFYAPGHKWNFAPTIALGWIASNEDFLQGNDIISFMKIRASWGRINSAYAPTNGYWTQTYDSGPRYYVFDTAYTNPSSTTMPGQMATGDDNTCPKADKSNLGIELSFFADKSLDLTVEGYIENRHHIWVDSSNKYSSILGFSAPYETAGKVVSKGLEIALDYHKTLGDFSFNVGGNFTFTRSEIKEQYEELKLYSNLETTGHPVGQIFGYESIGFFKDDADIANSPEQTLTTVQAGDIKYRDVNNDGIIDANDKTAIGYNSYCPEIYYSFNVGAEWKGLGFNALFQGAGNYSAYLTTTSVYLPLVSNTNISTEYYKNRWTEDNADNAKYPRLSMSSNSNNNVQNTTWVQNRSFLKLRTVNVYYNFPKSLLAKTKVINGAKIFAAGTDLACFDKIKVVDPECYGAGYPTTQNVVLGMQIQF